MKFLLFPALMVLLGLQTGCCHNRPLFGRNTYAQPQYYAQPVQAQVQYQQPVQYMQPQMVCPQVCPQVCQPCY